MTQTIRLFALLVTLLSASRNSVAGCRVITASELAAQASSAANECRWSDAIQLLDDATKELRCPSSDQLETFSARLRAMRKSFSNSRAAAKVLHRDIKLLLDQSRADTAFLRIQAAGLPACAVNTDLWEVNRRRAAAKDLLESGGHTADPKQTLSVLRDAARMNSETETLAGRISVAQRNVDRLPCRGCRAARKAFLVIGTTAAIAAVSYYGYRVYQNYQSRRPVLSFGIAR